MHLVKLRLQRRCNIKHTILLQTPSPPYSGRYIINEFFFTISRQKIGHATCPNFQGSPTPIQLPSTIPSPPSRGVILSMNFFSPFPDKKIGHFSTISDTPLNTPSSPLWGRYIINTVFLPFPDKKIGRFSTVFACPYFTVTARGCQVTYSKSSFSVISV